MAFKKGESGNKLGKPPGTRNSKPLEARIKGLLNENFGLIESQMLTAPDEVKTQLLINLLHTIKTN